MDIATQKRVRRKRAHVRIRGRVSGTAERPRLAVFKSGRYVYAQLIDDLDGSTPIFSGSVTGTTINLSDGDGTNVVGTIAGMSVSGTWSSDDPDSGNWTGSTANCP